MDLPFIGNIIMFGGTFAPQGWALCNGQLLSIGQNSALFSLIGTTYGGDGIVTFGLPDLRGRMPIHQGQGAGLSSYILGQMGGVEQVTLLTSQIPSHTHQVFSNSATATSTDPTNNFLAAQPDLLEYTATPPNAVMKSTAILNSSGGGQPHYNIMPFLCLNYVIALEGVYPTQN